MNYEESALLQSAKEASRILALCSGGQRSKALVNMAKAVKDHAPAILAANAEDIRRAGQEHLEQKRINILTISQHDIGAMADFFIQTASAEDLVGIRLEEKKGAGFCLEKRLQPVGVVGVVYEARPSVITDCAALCIRSGNALILCGSRHCINTDAALVRCLKEAAQQSGLPADAVSLFSGQGHEPALRLARAERLVDLLIVRGGYRALHDVKAAACVPVIGAGPGNCHIFIDSSAEYHMAEEIVVNSKVPRPLACNAAETLLVHREWANRFLPSLLEKLDSCGIVIHGCKDTCALWKDAVPAVEADWQEEYFSPDLAVKIVENVQGAVKHINCYRTPHTEAIITENDENTAFFSAHTEANVICHNASTRLTDGIVFGLGGEMGISTQKYPVGGPIGVCHLMQEKYYILGEGALR